MTRSKFIAAYEAAIPDDPIADDDPRRADIWNEMREVRAARSLEDAAQVIAWWNLPADETLRIAAKIRATLGVVETVDDPYQSLEVVIDDIKHGRAAGPIRNQQMAERADALVAVWDGASRGTGDMLRRALAMRRDLTRARAEIDRLRMLDHIRGGNIR